MYKKIDDIAPKHDFYAWMEKWFPNWEPQYRISGTDTVKCEHDSCNKATGVNNEYSSEEVIYIFDKNVNHECKQFYGSGIPIVNIILPHKTVLCTLFVL